MQTSIPVTYENLTRQERFCLWQRQNRDERSFAAIGRKIGISRASALRLCLKDHISTWRFSQLREAGIPEDLLPEARDIAPGKRPQASPEGASD